MVNHSFSNRGLHKAGFLLALFSTSIFAYNPPATPGVEIPFDFTGPTAEPEAALFYNTSCDSEYYSWHGSNMVCATGDPQNVFCTVWMVYYDTDVFDCQSGKGGGDPDPNPDPDPDPNPDSLQPKPWLPTPFTTELKDLHTDLGLVYDAILKGARQSSYTKTAIDMLDGQVFRGFTSLNASVNEVSSGISYGTSVLRSDIQLADTHNQILLNNVVDAIKSQSGGGGGSSYGDYMPALNHIANAVGNLSSIVDATSNLYGLNSNLAGQAQYIEGSISNAVRTSSDSEKALLTAINESIKSLGGGEGGDNSAVVEQLIESNNSLSDITIRMRDIENAIGKSEASIVDAIGKGGNGSDPDAISANGCEAFSCSTDSPQCFIARKEWEKSCATVKNEADAQGLIDSLVTSVKEYTESPDGDIQNIDAGVINTDSLLNKYTNDNGFNAGGQKTCPEPLAVDIGVTVLYINLTPMCDLAAVISFFVIATAMLSSGLAIAKYS